MVVTVINVIFFNVLPIFSCSIVATKFRSGATGHRRGKMQLGAPQADCLTIQSGLQKWRGIKSGSEGMEFDTSGLNLILAQSKGHF
jgi:hypothetical protein